MFDSLGADAAVRTPRDRQRRLRAARALRGGALHRAGARPEAPARGTVARPALPRQPPLPRNVGTATSGAGLRARGDSRRRIAAPAARRRGERPLRTAPLQPKRGAGPRIPRCGGRAGARRKQTLTVEVRNPDGSPAEGDFSLSVTDRAAVPRPEGRASAPRCCSPPSCAATSRIPTGISIPHTPRRRPRSTPC